MHRTLCEIATLCAITDNTTIFRAIDIVTVTITVTIVTAADVAAVAVRYTNVGVVCTRPVTTPFIIITGLTMAIVSTTRPLANIVHFDNLLASHFADALDS